MSAVEWVRFIIGAAFMLVGLVTFIVEMIGIFRFKYVMNRMHAAAMGDTLGLGASLIGLIIISGWNFTSLKLAVVILFLWFSSPVSSHLIARLEVTTDEEPEKHYDRKPIRKLEEELAAGSIEGAAGSTKDAADTEKAGEGASA